MTPRNSPLLPALTRLALPLDGPEFRLTLKARKTGGAEGLLVGVGTTNSSDYTWWNLGGWGNTQHGVERTAGGGRYLAGKAVPGRIESNRWYDVKIESDRKRVRFSLDGSLIHELPGTLQPATPTFAASCVKDSASGDVILMLVNGANTPRSARLELTGLKELSSTAEASVLAGPDPAAVNDFDRPCAVLPRALRLPAASSFDYEALANSFPSFVYLAKPL